jgi:hypothetical protein
MPIVEIVSALNKRHGLSMPAEILARRKESFYYELLPQLKPVPEVLEHIEAQHGQIPFAVVSGSALDSVTASLSTLLLLDKFDTLVCAGDYEKASLILKRFCLQQLGSLSRRNHVSSLKIRKWVSKQRPPQEWPQLKLSSPGRESRQTNLPQRTDTGPFTVETRMTVGPVPNSTRFCSSSQVLRPSLHTLAWQLNDPLPSDSSTTPD